MWFKSFVSKSNRPSVQITCYMPWNCWFFNEGPIKICTVYNWTKKYPKYIFPTNRDFDHYSPRFLNKGVEGNKNQLQTPRFAIWIIHRKTRNKQISTWNTESPLLHRKKTSKITLVGGWQPISTKIWVNLDHFPKDRGEHKKYLKPPPRYHPPPSPYWHFMSWSAPNSPLLLLRRASERPCPLGNSDESDALVAMGPHSSGWSLILDRVSHLKLCG